VAGGFKAYTRLAQDPACLRVEDDYNSIGCNLGQIDLSNVCGKGHQSVTKRGLNLAHVTTFLTLA
jgi:hypothetical protein